MVSKCRPKCPIIATTNDEKVMRRLALTWGVYPVKAEVAGNTDEVIENSIEDVYKRQVYICNIMTQPGETDDHNVLDHVNACLLYTSEIQKN